MIAAGLLLIPGYVTDAIGLIFFIPVLRIMLLFCPRQPHRPYSRTSFQLYRSQRAADYDQDPSPDPAASEQDASKVTIEGEFERKD